MLTLSCANLDADVGIYLHTLIGSKENKPGTVTVDVEDAHTCVV